LQHQLPVEVSQAEDYRNLEPEAVQEREVQLFAVFLQMPTHDPAFRHISLSLHQRRIGSGVC
jgi:hypothetical protein